VARVLDDLLEDGMIAATARIHGLTVVSRNTRNFLRLGLRAIDPFRAGAD
jgi:predicted nucleic acid-binding protein